MHRILAASLAALILAAPASAGPVSERVFRPDPLPATLDWQGLPPPAEIAVTTDDGLTIKGYRWAAACRPRAVMVYFHGNGGNRYDAALRAAPLRRDDVDLIVADYRGYGDNPGAPDPDGLAADARAFTDLALATGADETYLFGFSLGGAVALRAANERPVDALATLGTFTNVRDAAPKLARAFVPKWFDNRAEAARLATPWLLMHGTKDETIDPAHGLELKKIAGDRATHVNLTGAPHDILFDPIAERLWSALDGMAGAPSSTSDCRPRTDAIDSGRAVPAP